MISEIDSTLVGEMVAISRLPKIFDNGVWEQIILMGQSCYSRGEELCLRISGQRTTTDQLSW